MPHLSRLDSRDTFKVLESVIRRTVIDLDTWLSQEYRSATCVEGNIYEPNQQL